MQLYLVSLGAGILVGIIYGLLKVRSPAPPVVALVGLAGILIGQQLIPAIKELVSGKAVASNCIAPSMLGHADGRLPWCHPTTQAKQIAETARS